MSQRIEKINELIKREMGKIISREIEVQEGSLVTISQVKTSSDLSETKIWVSIFPMTCAKKVLKQLINKAGYLQRLLNRRLVMKYVPRIKFVLDSTEERAGQVENILKNIRG